LRLGTGISLRFWQASATEIDHAVIAITGWCDGSNCGALGCPSQRGIFPQGKENAQCAIEPSRFRLCNEFCLA
jgi:hypothetical protein